MNTEFRRSIAQARFNVGNSKIFSIQLVIVAAIIGVTVGSWWWGIVAFASLCFCCGIPYVAFGIVLVLSAAWGFAGYSIVASSMSYIEAGAIGVIVFIVGFGINFSGLTGLSDLS